MNRAIYLAASRIHSDAGTSVAPNQLRSTSDFTRCGWRLRLSLAITSANLLHESIGKLVRIASRAKVGSSWFFHLRSFVNTGRGKWYTTKWACLSATCPGTLPILLILRGAVERTSARHLAGAGAGCRPGLYVCSGWWRHCRHWRRAKQPGCCTSVVMTEGSITNG